MDEAGGGIQSAPGLVAAAPVGRRHRALPRFEWRGSLPVLALGAILLAILIAVPGARSYSGLTLLLSASIAPILAAMAQMFVITAGDIDLSLGAFVGLVNVICATELKSDAGLAAVTLMLCIAGYTAMGIVIHVRRIPAIIVTLGASFVWLGLAILVLPAPGGRAPDWLINVVNINPPLIPLPVLIAIVVAALGHLVMMATPYGVILRGIGGNPMAIRRAGWSLLQARATLYALAAVFALLAGLAVTGLTTSGDANVSLDYTLLTIASVILGGGEFSGGKAVPVGTVIGAITMSLAGSLLVFLNLPPDYQLGVQGAVLILVLAGRAVGRRKEG